MFLNSQQKEVPEETSIADKDYQTKLKRLCQSLDQERLFKINAFLQPSKHCVQLGFSQKQAIPRNTVVIAYKQQRPNCSPREGRPDWRDAVFFWLRKTDHLQLIDFAKNLLNDGF